MDYVTLSREGLSMDSFQKTLKIPDQEIDQIESDEYEKIIDPKSSIILYQEFGAKWIKSKKSLCLKVPTILILGEWSILVNPKHKSADKIKILDVEDFKFDDRFLK